MPRNRERAREMRTTRKREARLMGRALDLVDEALVAAEIASLVHREEPSSDAGFDRRFEESLEYDAAHALLVRAALANAFGIRVDHRLLETASDERLHERGLACLDETRPLLVALVDDEGGMPTFADEAEEFVLVAGLVVSEPARLAIFPVVYEPSEGTSRLVPPLLFLEAGASVVFELPAGVVFDGGEPNEHANGIVAHDQAVSAACAPTLLAAVEHLRSPASTDAIVHELRFPQDPPALLDADPVPDDERT